MSFEQRTIFLELFTKEIIKNSYGKGFKVKINPEMFQEEYEEEMKKIRALSGMNLSEIKTKKSKPIKKLQKEKDSLASPLIFRRRSLKKPEKVKGMFLQNQYTQQKKEQPPKETTPLKKTQITPSQKTQEEPNTFQKLKPILSDPRVFEIECPGPNKFILVKTTTKILNSGIKLNQNEIKSIIEYFSVQTRIPLIGGFFKAVKDNLLISSVFSEIAGSRFIIKKLSPLNTS
jgi:hypothetical protein